MAARLPCADPVEIPADIWDLSRGPNAMVRRVSGKWGPDRLALAECRDRNRALAAGVDAIEGQGR